jgi:hypothetical protein
MATNQFFVLQKHHKSRSFFLLWGKTNKRKQFNLITQSLAKHVYTETMRKYQRTDIILAFFLWSHYNIDNMYKAHTIHSICK